jgi:hypothetical protein
MSLHACGRRQMSRTRLPREQWSVSITGTGHAIEVGAVPAVSSPFLVIFDVTRDQSVSSNSKCRTVNDRMVAESLFWEYLHA